MNLEKNRAYIAVNEHYQTSLPHIYAIGDINGQIQLAHVASSQAENAISHIVKKDKKKEMSIVPSCLYTTPEAATVGLTEEEAKAQGIPVRTGKFLLSANGRHLIETSERGFVKVLMNQQDELIGAQMCGASVSELIPVLTNAIVQKINYTDLLKVIYPHPTISEGISEAIASVHNEAIHVFSKK